MGRDAPLSRLLAAAEHVASGGPGAAFWLDGAPGVGKTRLVEAFLARTPVKRQALGNCRPPTPFGPFAQALEPWLDEVLAGEVAPRVGPAFARLWPGCWEAAATLSPQGEAARLRQAMGEAIAHLSRAGGLVLALEDWHLADTSSSELAAWLVRHVAELPLVLVFTARPRAAGLPAWATAAEPLVLGPLDDEALATLVAREIDARDASEVPPDLFSELRAFSGGNPLLARQFLSHELLVRRVPQADAPSPLDVEALVASRLAPGRGLAQELAQLLALWGGEATVPQLARAAAHADEAVAEALSQLLAARLVTETPSGFKLSHARIGEALLGRATPLDRMRRHAAVARALADDLEPAGLCLPRLTAVAEHALAGGASADREAAIAYTLEAGRRCALIHANEAAEHFLDAGLAALRLDGRASRRQERMSGLSALGDVRRVTGRYEAARDAYEEALRLAVGPNEEAPRSRLLTSLAKVHQGLDDLVAACHHADEAMTVAQAVGADADEARAALTAARLSYYQGNEARARALTERALARARSSEDPVQLAEALAFSGHLALSHPEAVTQGLDALHESIALLSGVSDQPGLSQSYMLLGDAQAAAGDWPQARTSFKLARWICEELGNRTDEGIALLNLATAALELRDHSEALELSTAGLALASALGNRFQWAIARVLWATAAARSGDDATAALLAIHEGLDAMRQLDNRYLETLVWPWVAEAFIELGRGADALDAVRRARPTAKGDVLGKLDALERRAMADGGLGGVA